MADENKTLFYESEGYKVVRIPYFIQLSRNAVIKLFGIDVGVELFDENIPSITSKGRCTPAYLCPMGIERMKKEFNKFPSQFKVNLDYMKTEKDQILVGWELLI